MAVPDFTASKDAPVSGDSAEIEIKKLLSLAYNSRGMPQVAANIHAPAQATAGVVTFGAAGAGQKHVIRGVAYSYDTTPTGGSLIITDAGTTVLSLAIPAAGEKWVTFPVPIKSAAANTAMVLTLASGAGSVIGKINALGHSTEA